MAWGRIKTMSSLKDQSTKIDEIVTDRDNQLQFAMDHVTTNTGCPQVYVLPPQFFSLYTNDSQSSFDHVKVLKYADNMAFFGLLNHSKRHLSDGHLKFIDHFV